MRGSARAVDIRRPASAAAPVAAIAPVAAKPAVCSLRSDAPVVGNIVCDGPWEILCSIEGDLRGTDLVIAAGATVTGNVVARDVIVRGRVTGTIRAANVKLRGAAAVEGDIFHRTLLVEEDARFDGASRVLESG